MAMLQCRKEFLIVILASTLTAAPKSALGSVFGTLERLREVDDALIHAGKSLDDLYNLIEKAIGTTSSETTPTSLEPTESSRETSSSSLTSTATPSSSSTGGTSTEGPSTSVSTHLSDTTSTSSEPTESSWETSSSLLTSTATPSSSSTGGTSTEGPSTSVSTHLLTSDSSTSQHSVSYSPNPSGASSTRQSRDASFDQLPTDTYPHLPATFFIRDILRTKKDARIEALASISSSHQLSPRSLFKTALWNTVDFDNIQQRSSFLKHMIKNALENLNPILDGTKNSDSGFAILGNENSSQRMKELFYDKIIKVSAQEGLSPALTNSNMAEVGNQTDSTFRELLSSIKNSLTTGLNGQFQLSPKDQFVTILKWLLSTWKIMEKADNANNSHETYTISTSAESDNTTEVTTSDKTTKITTSDETTRLSTPSPTVMTTSTTQVTVSTTPKTPASWRNETTAVVQAMVQVMLQIDDGNADHTHAFELEQSASLLDDLVLEGKEFEEAGQLDVSSEDLAKVASVKKVAQASEETIKEKIDEAEVKTVCQSYE
ncbi:uncharacterized protein [Macrobrachium rosenbergii]|uniref:uncharacterized protein isoform X2 n=1 Tax=Macrobrachium rosenbergii TaxID=79674 RepID=UPI0034D6DE5E